MKPRSTLKSREWVLRTMLARNPDPENPAIAASRIEYGDGALLWDCAVVIAGDIHGNAMYRQ